MQNNELPDVNAKRIKSKDSWSLKTHNGHKLSIMEDKFITLFIEYGDEGKAAKEAGYRLRSTIKDRDTGFRNKGKKLLEQVYIQQEVEYRMQEYKNEHIADAQEIMMYLTSVMRGEVKDQFDLDAPLAERTSAAKELAKRLIDAPNKTGKENELHVTIERKKRK